MCLWIASKYEEIYPPRMQNYVQVTDGCYGVGEFREMEGRVLLALGFRLNHTTPLQILEVVCDKWAKDQKGRLTKEATKSMSMCKYVI